MNEKKKKLVSARHIYISHDLADMMVDEFFLQSSTKGSPGPSPPPGAVLGISGTVQQYHKIMLGKGTIILEGMWCAR